MLKHLKLVGQTIKFIEWLKYGRHGELNQLRDVAKRILRVMGAHNIPATKIENIFPELSVRAKHFKNPDSLVEVLDASLIDGFTEMFYLNREWLHKGDGNPQNVFEVGYDFDSVYEYLKKLKRTSECLLSVIFIAQTGMAFTPVKDHPCRLGLTIVLQFDDYEEDSSSSYQILYAGYWDYYKTRMMAKAISFLCFQLGINQRGCFSAEAGYPGVEKCLAAEIVKRFSPGSWHPDDYIFASGTSSSCLKDPEDALRMHEYLREIDYFEKVQGLRESG